MITYTNSVAVSGGGRGYLEGGVIYQSGVRIKITCLMKKGLLYQGGVVPGGRRRGGATYLTGPANIVL